MYEVQMIPLGQIAESPLNPRKIFGDMEDLTADVKKRGILQPVLVRTLKGKADYELVFGARRYRAAKAAGLEEVPAMVRTLQDDEALELMIVENCKRTDIHPMEEAEAYQQLHERHRHQVEDIAAKVGKSKAYVYGRMKLCALAKPARKAFLEGKLTPSVALLVARIPPQLQEKATHELTHERTWNGKKSEPLEQPLAFREASEWIQREYMLRLDQAPFSRTDAELLPAAGPCSTCPKRTGNQRELFEDVKSADVCTDPPCFKKKADAEWDRRVSEAKATGQKVLSEKEAKIVLAHNSFNGLNYNSGYADLNATTSGDLVPYSSKIYNKPLRPLLRKSDVPVVLARHPDGKVFELVDAKEAKAALKKAGHLKQEKTRTSKSGSKASTPKKGPKERELRQKTAVSAIAAIVEKAEKKDDLAFWRVLAQLVWENESMAGDPGPIVLRRQMPARSVLARIAKAKVPELRGLVVELQFVGPLERFFEETDWSAAYDGYPSALEIAAKAFGVDLKKLEKEITATEAIKAAEASFQKPATKKAARKK